MQAAIKIFISFWCIPILLFGQETKLKDTTLIKSDTVNIDTTKTLRDTSTTTGVDTIVVYSSADSIIYSIGTRVMSMYSKGQIKYQTMELESDRIDVNWNTSTLTAFGIQDTSDTSKQHMIGLPVLKDKDEVYDGKELGYNFKTRRGRIIVADTKMDEGFYHGEQLKKVGKDVLFVADGRYTTCDKSDPHYYFFSPKMKVTLQDKVIAEPIYMYIADVPVFWFPVAVFPSKGGRRSGFIPPAIAEDATHGRLLRHIGYYWAINDYMDWSVKTDLYTKGSWAIFSNYQYKLRYYFSGGLSGEYRKMLEGESSDPNRRKNLSYNVHISHHQEINPTTRADVNFTFASNNSYLNTINLNQALQQDITSNATISKYWEGTPNSVSMSISRRQNLTNGNINETLPSLSFNHSQSFPFRSSKNKSSDISKLLWYEMIGVSYNANFSNNRAKTQTTIKGITTNINGIDTSISVNDYRFDRNYRLSQGFNMSISPKVGYFTISPSMNYSDERSLADNKIPDSSQGQLIKRNERVWSRKGTFSSGVSANTKLYGIFQPNLLGIEAFRHTLSPSLAFIYSKQVVGENLPKKQMLLNLTVSNNFEMKTKPEKEEEEGKKIQLLNLNTGISYNFAADSLNFSPFILNYRTNIANKLDVGGNVGYDLYKFEQTSPGHYERVNKFLIVEEGRLARMTNFSISLSTSLSGERKGSASSSTSDTLRQHQVRGTYRNLLEEEEPDFSIPWSLSLSWDYSENKEPTRKSKSSNIRGNLEFNLTTNWKFYISGGYDIKNHEMVLPQINISRDLHCWIMNFTWVPLGPYRFYSFEIRLKAPQLQDIKVTKTGSASGIY
jgi:lipopolysaccharide assembly outer membrane protein LptD (OstA)